MNNTFTGYDLNPTAHARPSEAEYDCLLRASLQKVAQHRLTKPGGGEIENFFANIEIDMYPGKAYEVSSVFRQRIARDLSRLKGYDCSDTSNKGFQVRYR